MVIRAVKVTGVPAQMVTADAVIFAVGVTTGLTVIVTVLLVTDAGVAQVALEVNTQVMISPLLSVLSIKLLLLVPIFTPFFFH